MIKYSTYLSVSFLKYVHRWDCINMHLVHKFVDEVSSSSSRGSNACSSVEWWVITSGDAANVTAVHRATERSCRSRRRRWRHWRIFLVMGWTNEQPCYDDATQTTCCHARLQTDHTQPRWRVRQNINVRWQYAVLYWVNDFRSSTTSAGWRVSVVNERSHILE